MRKKTYWLLTTPFLIVMLLVSLAYMVQQQHIRAAMIRMGYPLWVLKILALAIILGVIAIATEKNQRLKEWAYAGFFFHFIGASLSHAFSGDNPGYILAPLGLLLWCFASYRGWHQQKKF